METKVLAVLAGLGFEFCARKARLQKAGSLTVAVLLAATLLSANIQDESHNTAVGMFGRTLLQGLPAVSIRAGFVCR